MLTDELCVTSVPNSSAMACAFALCRAVSRASLGDTLAGMWYMYSALTLHVRAAPRAHSGARHARAATIAAVVE